MLWFIILVATAVISYVLFIKPFSYWSKKNVPQQTTSRIIFDAWNSIFQKIPFSEITTMMYNYGTGYRYYGVYQFATPTLFLRDPDLIKQIAVKDFDHFLNHSTFVPEGVDPLWSKNLFALKNEPWREMRSTLSPAFTSSKMKFMFSLISENGEQFVKYFLKQKEDVITVEMKDTLTRFANDVIASTAFGVKCDSLEEKENYFYLMGKDATDLKGFWTNIKFLAYFLCPSVVKKLNLPLFRKEVSTFFRKVISDTIRMRQEKGIVRPDMVHLLMEARKTGLQNDETSEKSEGFATADESNLEKKFVTKQALTDEDITAQALIFFFAGFDSVSTLMCFMAHELAIYPDIQEKLIEEIDDSFKECNGKLTYDVLVKMKYLDMVVSETLRKWPPTALSDRVCNIPFTIEPQNPNESPVQIKKDIILWIPIFAIHRDPQYFPDPDGFNPERFSEENKKNIKPYTYIPFGAGPRNCIGSRFALLETKALFFHILTHFKIVAVEKTENPVQLDPQVFSFQAKNGFWLGLEKRRK